MKAHVDVRSGRMARVLRLKAHDLAARAERDRAGRQAKWAARRKTLWASLARDKEEKP
ncbi:MAG TPA: hypothetical protein VGN97_20445 [Mesorhizobium sp.]|jgi:hypothetical protein|nr:hypothetical protein [Mesorhizobium sp.]